MKREKLDQQKKAGKFVPPDDPLLQKLPHLAEAVADLFWDDGSPREPYTVSANWASGSCTLQLNDKEGRRSVASTASSLSEALMLLEELLQRGALPWRYWPKEKSRRG